MKPKHSWKDNTKIDRRGIGWADMDCSNVAVSCEHGKAT